MTMVHCPNCDDEMGREEGDDSVGVTGGYYCAACDVFVPEWDVDRSDDYLD